MKTCDRVLAGVVVCLLAAGCISTSTGAKKAEPDDGDAAELNYQLGARYYHSGNYELARDRLQLAVKLKPDFALAYSTLGLTYERLDNLRLAGEAYDQAVYLAPKDHGVQNTYAVFLCRQGRFDDAAEHFEKAAQLPDNDDAEVTLTNAGVCMMQKPDYAQAEVFFRQALQARAEYGEALLQMCVLKHEMQDDLIARAFMQRYLSSNKVTADVLYLGMQIEVQLGDQRARTEFSDRILREFPESTEARRILDAG